MAGERVTIADSVINLGIWNRILIINTGCSAEEERFTIGQDDPCWVIRLRKKLQDIH